jgi:hypothetical protein
MALASGWYTQNMLDTFDASALAIDLTLATYKIVLYNNTRTPAFDTASGYTATNEVTGTGWAAGGVLLSAAAAGATSTAPTLTISPATVMMWDMGDISVASTTLTAVRGCDFYADPVTTPTADAMILEISFGADYATTAGTLGVQFAATGVGTVDWA